MSILKRLQDKLTGGTLKDAATYLERGNRHFAQQNWQTALADFDQAVELASTASEQAAAYFNRGRTYSRLEHWDAAIADFDYVARLAPVFPLVYQERGACFEVKGDHITAIAEFDKAIALLPPGLEQAMAYFNRGVVHDALGRYHAALADINKAIELAPELTPAYRERERVQQRARSIDAASQASAEAHPPFTAEQFCERGWVDSASNNLVSALVNFRCAIEQSPTDCNVYYGCGVVNAKLRRYEQALADLNKALALQPRFPAALTERGLVYVELGEYAQAMSDYDEAIKVDSTYALAHINKGSLYAIQEQWSAARASLDVGINLHPTPEAYYNRAAVCAQLGEYRRAAEDLRNYLHLRPDDRLAEKARQRLKELEEKL